MFSRCFTVTLGSAVTALALLCVAPPAAHAQVASHIYELNGNLADTLGGPSLVNNGATQNPNGLIFGANQGPSLSNVLTSPTYSVELYFEFDLTTGYRRILDFKNRTSDTGLYNLNTSLNFYNVTTGVAGAFADTAPAHVILTRDGTSSLITGYVNGVQQISFTDSSNLGVFDGANNIAYFFVDDSAVGGEASPGSVDYIRLYNTALTQTEVTNRFNNRGTFFVSNATAPEPSALALLLPAFGLLGGAVRARRKTRS